jgi:hydroxyacylglutathione hydrolase
MIFRQFYLKSLGHASYLVGDEATGRALVLDPRRDVDIYFEAARREGLRIVHAVDTHGHNDYLTGIIEIARRADVELLGFHEAALRYAHRPIKDGEVIEFGDVGFEVMHTPGHTPEHISLCVYDRSSGAEQAMFLSGGALLVGDLARPDLLGGVQQAQEAAITFCHTIQEKILWKLADHVEVWPTHVAGSLCGSNIGSRLSTTVGYERKTNAILAKVSSSDEFVDECIRLDNLPAVPPYWRRMRAQNFAGPAPVGVLPEPAALQPDDFEAAAADGIILDTRSPEAFAGGHIPGSLSVGLGPSFPTWAGTVLPEGAHVYLVVEDPDDLLVAAWELLRIGYDPPLGWLAGGMGAWRSAAKQVDRLTQFDAGSLREAVAEKEVDVLDVRQPAEWAAGHIDGATFITGAELPARLDEVPADRPVAVVCGSGYRSTVMASLLKATGRRDVSNMGGGMSAWRRSGLPTVK